MGDQYNRRESFEIAGIPENVADDKLEEEVIQICNEAGVKVHGNELSKTDICAVHRLKDKKTTIVRVMNRKFSRSAKINSKNLKGSNRYGRNTGLYINDNFCPEFKFLFFCIRKAASIDKSINRWKIKNGIIHIQLEANGRFYEIGHEEDLKNLGVTVRDRKVPRNV